MNSLLLCLGWNSVAYADNPFRVEIPMVQMVPEQTKDASITFVVPKGFHLYQDMMSVQVQSSPEIEANFVFGELRYPVGHLIADPANPEQMREVFEETVTVALPLTAKTLGVHTVQVDVRYQGCKETLCYMPKTDTLDMVVKVLSKEDMQKANTPAPVQKVAAPVVVKPEPVEDSCWYCFWR